MPSRAKARAAVNAPARRVASLVFAAILPFVACPTGAAAQTPLEASMAQLQAGAPSFGECEAAVDEAALRQEMFDGAREAMSRAAGAVDYRDIVRKSWLAARFDQKFERIVDAKIAVMRADRPYLERLLDGNIPSRAEDMAERTARLVFESPEFEALSQDLQREIAKRLEPLIKDADAQAGDRVRECVQTFLGARYAATVRDAFTAGAANLALRGEIDKGDVGVAVAFSLAGVVAAMLTVVFRRLVRRIVRTVVQRLAGAIAARLAAASTVVLGVAMLIYDLIAGADGVFPVIRDELVSAETRQTIQEGLVTELSAAGPKDLEQRATEIAALMFDRWRDFKENHHAVLALADQEPRFRAFLKEQPPQRFEALSVVVRQLKAEGGDAAVLAALDHGLLSEALLIDSIAADLEFWVPRGVGLDALIAWSRAAGPLYGAALEARLPDVIGPRDLDRASLERLLALNGSAARQVAAMPAQSRAEALLESPDLLEPLALRHDAAALDTLFRTLRAVKHADQRETWLAAAAGNPTVSAVLTRSGVAGAVTASRAPELAIEILLDPAARWNPLAMADHVSRVMDGDVAPMTLVMRYGWGLAVVLGAPLLMALGLLRSVLGMLGIRRRRRTV